MRILVAYWNNDFGVMTRGLRCESYSRSEYRPTIKVDGEVVFVGVEVGDLRFAIRESEKLARYFRP